LRPIRYRRFSQTWGCYPHYAIAGGRFESVCRELLAGGACVAWQSREDGPGGGPGKGKRSKTKYTCLSCGCNAWAKPSANLVCEDCGETMESE
jgi:hypothetical protein